MARLPLRTAGVQFLDMSHGPGQHGVVTSVGTLNERSLHAQLKEWCARPGDRFEVPVGRHVVDVVRGELLIEIQTARIGALRDKLAVLLDDHDVTVLLPIPVVKWIVKMAPGGEVLDRRRSPKRGSLTDVFAEMVSVPTVLDHPRFSLTVAMTEETEVRRHSSSARRRRGGWRTVERRLERVLETTTLMSSADLVALLPPLPDQWTTADLAAAAGVRRRLGQQAAYTLREAGRIRLTGKRGNALVYTLI